MIQTINDRENALEIRNKINSNFNEHTSSLAALGAEVEGLQGAVDSVSARIHLRIPIAAENGLYRKLAGLVAGSPTQVSIGVIGDSWVQNPRRGMAGVAKELHSRYGFGGNGYTAFSFPGGGDVFGTARPDLYSVELTGAWESLHYGQSLPSQGRIQSSVVGDKVTVNFPAGHISAKLYYSSSSGSSVRYRFNGGGWTTLSTASGSPASLPGLPDTEGVLEIEVVAGTARLGGVDLRCSSGVVIHNLGSSGSTSSQWGVAGWQTSMAGLEADAFVVMLGANDLSNDRPPAEFASFIDAIVAKCKTASPNADIVFVSQPTLPVHTDTPSRLYTRQQYLSEVRLIADSLGIDVVDLQPAFGNVGEYRSDGILPLMAEDGSHVVEWGFGATVVAHEFIKILRML
jgi:hypothetical protein